MSRNSRKRQMMMTRRQALAALGVGVAATQPGLNLLNALVDGIIGKAMAAGNPDAGILFNYHLTGAPARWHWDLPLHPYSASYTPQASTMLKTKMSGSGGTPIYGTSPITLPSGEILYMPALWGSPIPTANGSSVNMSELAKNMLIVRGVDMASGGHQDGANEKTRPAADSDSIMGRVADSAVSPDGSPKPVQSAKFGAQFDSLPSSFKSKSSSLTETRSETPLNDLLSPFNRSSDNYGSTYMNRRQAMDTLIKQGLAKLGTFANSNQPGADALFSMRNSAESLMISGVTAALNLYPATLVKYQKIIRDCKLMGQTSVFGAPSATVPSSQSTDIGKAQTLIFSAPAFYITNPDVRTIIDPGSSPGLGTVPDMMAENFAVAEILISQGLSSSIMAGNRYVRNLHMMGANFFSDDSSIGAGNLTNGNYNTWDQDEHDVGNLTSLVINAFLFHALSACIYELQSALSKPSVNLWGKTVVMVTSDFGRIIRLADGSGRSPSGSDHDQHSCNYSFFSGAITKPSVLGNTGPVSPDDAWKWTGEFGRFRPVSNVGGSTRALNGQDAISSVATLLNVSTPTPNFGSLVQADGTPLIEKAKQAA